MQDCLKWIQNLADAIGRSARWRLRISEFEFNVLYWAETKCQAGEALLRMLSSGHDFDWRLDTDRSDLHDFEHRR